jgi:uncharacterized tellurite resistance protein B-like protein
MGWIALALIVVVVALLLAKGGKSHAPRRAASRTTPRASSPAPRQPSPLHWIGAGQQLKVAGFTISDPRVYASKAGSGRGGDATDPSEIVLAAEVRRPSQPLDELGYWPWYSRIPPEHRHEYLRWLASGRSSIPPVEGYLFLYYYGLERRLLVDNQDRGLILQEVLRLKKLDEPRRGTGKGGSFRRYSSGLLWFEIGRAPGGADRALVEEAARLTDHWFADTLAAALSWFAHEKQPLPAEWALRVAQQNPRSVQSVVVKRVPEEFNQLFRKRYKEKFGAGLAMRVSKRPKRLTYRPASAGLSEAQCTIADPTGIPSQFEPFADIWNSCIEDLRKLSKVADGVAAQLSTEEWEAMPAELRQGVDHPLTRNVQSVVARHAAEDGVCLVAAGEFASLFGVEERPKLTAAQARRVAEALEFTCHGVEPDPRLGARPYAWDERISVFLRLDDSPVEVGRYSAASCMLRLGLAVAEADGTIDEQEMRRVTEHIENVFQLPDHERRRLEALKSLLLKEGAQVESLGRKLEQTLTAPQRQSVGRLLVAIAASDGLVDRSEVSALRKCFRLLGLGPEVLEQTLAELSGAGDDGMVTVQTGGRAPRGEPIPPRPEETGLRLDRASISAIMAETREVAKLLAAAMVVEEDSGDGMTSTAVLVERRTSVVLAEAAPDATAGSSAPEARYAPFYMELIARDQWGTDEARELARRHGVMLAGAIEAINDWAFDALGGPLVEETDEAILIDRSML